MKTQELHIGIDIELQKLNSFVSKNILPQEKDWFINKEVLKYINKKVNPDGNVQRAGFGDTVKRVQDFKELVKTSPLLPTNINEEGNAVVALPSDFYFPIRGDIRLAKDCNTIVNQTQLEYRVEFKINVDSDILTNYKIELTTVNGLQTIFNFSEDLPSDYLKSLDFKKQTFMLIKALQILLPKKLKELLNSPFDLYWEFDREGFSSDTFILYTTEKIFGVSVNFNNTVTSYPSISTTIPVYDITNYPISSNIRLVDDEFFSDNVNSHLSKSTAKSPVSRQLQQYIEVQNVKGFVMGGMKITYISKPTLSDLLLNSNINMNRNSLNEILSNTVTYIKGVISSPNYQTYKNENILVE